MKKKGYYFTIEATLGVLILATSFFVVLYFTESVAPVPEYRYAENVAGYLSYVTLGEFCSDGCEGLSIADLDLKNYTLLDVIGYTYSKLNGTASNVTDEIFVKGDLLLRGKEMALTITDITCDVLYASSEISCQEGANETTEIAYRKVIQGYVLDEDSGDLDFWGDYVVEVRVW